MLRKKIDSKECIVSVVGLGYVGLTLSIVIAEQGITVYGYEHNEDIFKSLSSGECHFYERGIQGRIAELVSEPRHDRKLNIKKNIDCPSDIWIITVGTPVVGSEKVPDLQYVEHVTDQISKYLKKGDLVLARSTVPVGTTRSLIVSTLETNTKLKAGEDFYVSFAPERTIEGAALEEIKVLPQVIGGINQASADHAKSFFDLFVDECIIAESIEAAEMIKLIDNTYRDFIFAYANQMSIICSKVDVNFNNLVTIANHNYPRNKVPMSSPGVGGACLSKDPYILRASAKKNGSSADFIIHGREINESMPGHIISQVLEKAESLNLNMDEIKIFLMGIAFKGEPATSDVRDSVAIDYISILKSKGIKSIWGYDQYVNRKVIESLGIEYANIEEGIRLANIVMTLNNNPNYVEKPIYAYLMEAKKPIIFFDGWNQFNSETYRNIESVHYMGC